VCGRVHLTSFRWPGQQRTSLLSGRSGPGSFPRQAPLGTGPGTSFARPDSAERSRCALQPGQMSSFSPRSVKGRQQSPTKRWQPVCPLSALPTRGSVVRDGQDGFVVPVGDVRAMVELLMALSSDPGLLAVCSEMRQRVTKDFRVEAYGRRLIQVLRNRAPHIFEHLSGQPASGYEAVRIELDVSLAPFCAADSPGRRDARLGTPYVRSASTSIRPWRGNLDMLHGPADHRERRAIRTSIPRWS
jgi:hypothetical protein